MPTKKETDEKGKQEISVIRTLNFKTKLVK